MSSDPSILLRMLEPAVRPGSLHGGASMGPAAVPFESRTFEDLLGEARGQATSAQPAAQEPPSAPERNPLASLADSARIENATLRDVLAQMRSANG